MARRVDLSGRKIGRLTPLEVCGKDKYNRKIWLCTCDCGREKPVPSRHLVNGAVLSCGCYAAEVYRENGKRGAHKIRGPLSHLYKSNLTDAERVRERNLVEAREWRAEVFRISDYKCDLCGIRGGEKVAHHLDCWSSYPDRRFDPSNGICLCATHHKDFHQSLGGPRIPCTEADYQEFKARWYLNREIERRRAAATPTPEA